MKFVPNAIRQLTDELTLGASISLSERMNPVYLGEQNPHLVSEIFPREAFQEIIPNKILKHRCQLALNQFRRREARYSSPVDVISLDHSNCAKLAGPFVNILKERFVDSLEMLGIEVSLQRIGL